LALHPGEVLLIPGGTAHSAVVGDQDVVTLNVWRLRSTVPT
jgi:quercetin dioxygenase-like cupin family protein